MTISIALPVAGETAEPGRAENFIDQGELVAMKTVSGGKAPRCDKDQFVIK